MSWFEYPLQYSRIRPQYSGAWLDIYSQHFRNLFGYLPQYSGVWLDIQTQFLDIYEPQSVPAHPGPENLGSAMRTLDRRRRHPGSRRPAAATGKTEFDSQIPWPRPA